MNCHRAVPRLALALLLASSALAGSLDRTRVPLPRTGGSGGGFPALELSLSVTSVAPLTTQPMAAPSSLRIPRESQVTLSVSSTAPVVDFAWAGIEEVAADAFSSSASARFRRRGTFEVRVTPRVLVEDGSLQPVEEAARSILLDVTGDRASEVAIEIIDPAPGPIVGYAGKVFQCHARTVPSGYEHLVEWRGGQQPASGNGPTFTTSFVDTGSHVLRAGPSAGLDFQIYRVSGISHTSQHGEAIWYGYPITFIAETDPPGFQGDVSWVVDTHEDMMTRAVPDAGAGPTFTTTFEPTSGGSTFWAQVYATNVAALGNPDVDPLPSIQITSPTTEPSYATSTTPITLSGVASDNLGVTQVTWVASGTGSGIASGTTVWTASDIPLLVGPNLITVRAHDTLGQISEDTLLVTYSVADGESPSVTITSPTSSPTFSTAASPLALSGTASDNVGVTQVTWANSAGGGGTASGTTSWSIAGVVLQTGENVLTVTARDAAGNTGQDVLTVTYTCGDGDIDAGEDCDGGALGGATCRSEGQDSGVLSCSATCGFDTSSCLSELDADSPAISDADPVGQESGCGTGCSLKNEPDPGQNRQDAGSSVLLHSGQELRDEIDLVLAGRDDATTLRIKRRHLTRRNYGDSIFGYAWAFNYRQILRRDPADDVLLESYGRIDRFQKQAADVWEGTEGRFGRLTYDPALAEYILRMPNGSRMVFEADPLESDLPAHLKEIVSSNDNRIVFSYLPGGDLVARRLDTITETYGRVIEFFYDDPDFPAGVSRIRDWSGREVLYDYNPTGQLLSVRSPTVTSTGGLNDFPSGKLTTYTYLDHADEKLRNALTSIVFPNENAGGGESRLAWTYETDPASPFFGYVRTHSVGNPAAPAGLAAGGVYAYAYTQVGDRTSDLNTASLQVDVQDRRGTITTYRMNRIGHVLSEEVQTNQDFRGTGGPAAYLKTFIYNEDGHVVQRVDTLGTTTDFSYDDASASRGSQGNATDRVQVADARGADQASIEKRVVHEPIFNKPFQVINPRGFEAGNTVEEFTTTYVFDYMEDLVAARARFAPEMGLSEAELQQLFDDAGITDLAADVNGDGLTDQFCGNVIRIEHPDVILPLEAARLGLGPIQSSDQLYRYNQFGQMIYERDAEENVFTYEYYGADDPDGNGVIDVPGADSATGGYLRRTVRDASAATGRNGGHDPAPAQQAREYEYVAQPGGIPENLRGVPTVLIDPRGIRHFFLVNELDQLVKTLRAADVSDSPEAGLSAFSYERIALYDHNDNIIETRIQNKDTLDGDDDFIVHTHAFDILDQRRSETFDQGGLAITNTYAYDESQNLVEAVRGAGKPEQSVERWLHDERDILVTHTRGFGTLEESTITTVIDDNGNIVEIVDADGGHSSVRDYDGHDRVRTVTDRVGNTQRYSFDSSGNVVSVESRGPVDEASSDPTTLLYRTDTHYDERNRPFRTDDHLFHYAGKEVGVIDDGGLDPGDGLVSAVTIYDRMGRVVGLVDADDDTYETRYDGLSRVIRSIDAMTPANETVRTYDPSDNLLTIRQIERSSMTSEDEEFITTRTYDALDRMVELQEANGQTTSYEYDSRDNLVRATDALGNQVESRHDRIDRLVEARRYLSAGGTGGTATNKDSSQGGGDGVVTLLQSWDDLGRLTASTDDNGNQTSHTYDDLDRRTRTDYPDGTFETWSYNADSELQQHRNQKNSVATWTHDAASRRTAVSVDNSGATSTTVGSTGKTWGYDGLDRVTRETDDNGAGEDVFVSYTYDSLSRTIREAQTVGTRPTVLVDLEWEGARRRVAETYPNGRRVVRAYDADDRLSRIEESGGSLIASFDYIGSVRDLLISYGNGTALDKRNTAGTRTDQGAAAGYDANRRHVRHEWIKGDGSTVTAYVSTYNGPSGIGTNRRASELREHLSSHLDTYAFDSLYRMIGFDRDGFQMSSRTLDGADSMTAFDDEGADRMPVVDGIPAEAGMNQYSSFGGRPRSHDESGALVEDGSREYRYDSYDRLVEVRDPSTGALLADYSYTAGNQRVLKVTPGNTVRYVYRGWDVLEERDGADQVLRQYVDGRALDDHIQMTDVAAGETYYYHCNSQGSVGAISDASGAVVEYYEYSWLGVPRILAPDGSAGRVRYTDTVDDVFFDQGQTTLSEEASSTTGWLENELVGDFLVMELGGETRFLRITSNISFLDDPVLELYTNVYTVAEDIVALGAQIGDAFTIAAAPFNPVGDTTRAVHGGTAADVYTEPGISNVEEQMALVGWSTNELVGHMLTLTIDAQVRHYAIIANISFEESPGVFTNIYTIAGEDLDILFSVSEPFSITPRVALPLRNPYLFQGRRADAESGLYYYRNRYYAPGTGRFLQQDPSGARNWQHGQGNGYSAFAEDPWNRIDPLGLGDLYVPTGKTDLVILADTVEDVPEKAASRTNVRIVYYYDEDAAKRGEEDCCEMVMVLDTWKERTVTRIADVYRAAEFDHYTFDDKFAAQVRKFNWAVGKGTSLIPHPGLNQIAGLAAEAQEALTQVRPKHQKRGWWVTQEVMEKGKVLATFKQYKDFKSFEINRKWVSCKKEDAHYLVKMVDTDTVTTPNRATGELEPAEEWTRLPGSFPAKAYEAIRKRHRGNTYKLPEKAIISGKP